MELRHFTYSAYLERDEKLDDSPTTSHKRVINPTGAETVNSTNYVVCIATIPTRIFPILRARYLRVQAPGSYMEAHPTT